MTGDLVPPVAEAVRMAEMIGTFGFSCTRCGSCCRDRDGDPWYVFVSPVEIRRIEAATGLCRDQFAGPYHETVKLENGTIATFGWTLHRKDDSCIFLRPQGCAIHPFRPWICRSFPFSWDGSISCCDGCPGTGASGPSPAMQPPGFQADVAGNHENGPTGAALMQAFCLSRRRKEESAEESGVRRILTRVPLPGESRVVIDSSGVTVLHG
jgi:uncharacterized protein